jgi:hypothetical protein
MAGTLPIGRVYLGRSQTPLTNVACLSPDTRRWQTLIRVDQLAGGW